MHNLGFCLLAFHHRVQWRGAKTVSKACWGPCHGLIPSLDFAQNYSPQIERRDQNWRGTFDSLDSEKAIEPCISLVTECLSWSTFDWVCADDQPRTPWHDIKPLLESLEWKVEKVEDEMETCVNIFQHVELSAVRRKTKPFPDSILGFDEGDFCRFAKESLSTEIGKGRHWTSVFFCGCTSSSQDSPKASPIAIFKWKSLTEQLNLLLKWMLNEGRRRLSMLSSMDQRVATLQFDSCAEKDSLCGRVMMAWI